MNEDEFDRAVLKLERERMIVRFLFIIAAVLIIATAVNSCHGQSTNIHFTYTKNPNGTMTLVPVRPCYEVLLQTASSLTGPWLDRDRMWSAPGVPCGSFSFTTPANVRGEPQRFWRLIIVR